MSYLDKVKKCKSIISAILSLKPDETISIIYKGDTYAIRAYRSFTSEGEDMSYSVWDNGFRGMNVSKVGRTSLALYSYDMMSQKTTYTLDLSKCSIANPESDHKSKAA